jgi:hypothetical protein
VTDAQALRLKIQGQIDCLEKGLGWLKDGTLRAPEVSTSDSATSRNIEMMAHYERILAALKAMLAELG